MSITAAPDIEAVDLEDFEFERPCVPWDRSCGKTAEWLAVKPCCGIEIPLCNADKERAVADMMRWYGRQTICLPCGASKIDRGDHVRWVKL